MYLYLYLNLFTLFFPLVLSFDRRVRFYQYWPSLFPAIFISGVFFVVWDELFTRLGVWGFNPDYLTGIYIGNLPLEEVLFFVTVPYATVFIYECLNYYVKQDFLQPYSGVITLVLTGLLLVLAFVHLDKYYPAVTFLLLANLLGLHYRLFRTKLLGRFYFAYLVHLIPFLLVNGVLTAVPIVWYNDQHNLSLRIGTIPVEDTLYSMLLLLLTITLYEWFKRKKPLNKKEFHGVNKVSENHAPFLTN
jgi:lycopene cyclase domain-containing protein